VVSLIQLVFLSSRWFSLLVIVFVFADGSFIVAPSSVSNQIGESHNGANQIGSVSRFRKMISNARLTFDAGILFTGI
jgi:hypothetical protein